MVGKRPIDGKEVLLAPSDRDPPTGAAADENQI
jgi:hypothetical protein